MFPMLLVMRRQDQDHHKSVNNMHKTLVNDTCSNISYPANGRSFSPVEESATGLLAVWAWETTRDLTAGCSMHVARSRQDVDRRC